MTSLSFFRAMPSPSCLPMIEKTLSAACLTSLSVRITLAPTSLAVRSTVVIPISSSSIMSIPSCRSLIVIEPTLGTVTVLAPLGKLNCSISANAGALCSSVYLAELSIILWAFSKFPVVDV